MSSKKFKKLVRSVSEKSGVSHAGAVNLLRRGNPAPLKALDPVLVRAGAKPLAGKHVHEAGIVSAILEDGDIMVTPAEPRRTRGGVSFWKHEEPARYSPADVRRFPLKKGERFARFVEDVFDLVPLSDDSSLELPVSNCSSSQLAERQSILWKSIVDKPPGKTAYVIGEEGDTITAITKPRRVIIPLWRVSADFVDSDGRLLGSDAVKIMRAIRDRMLALIDCLNVDYDILGAGDGDDERSGGRPDRRRRNLSVPPEGTEWYVNDIDDDLSGDRGVVYDSPPSNSLSRYGCGKGKVGRYISGSTSAGLYLLEGEVSIVSPSKPDAL